MSAAWTCWNVTQVDNLCSEQDFPSFSKLSLCQRDNLQAGKRARFFILHGEGYTKKTRSVCTNHPQLPRQLKYPELFYIVGLQPASPFRQVTMFGRRDLPPCPSNYAPFAPAEFP
jgi:hypothetical protein